MSYSKQIPFILSLVLFLISCSEQGNGQTIQKANDGDVVKAAQQGDAYAQFSLGTMYYTGADVLQNKAKAIEWYKKAAEQGEGVNKRLAVDALFPSKKPVYST